MYKLHYAAGACSMAVHVMLEELGAEYETNHLDMGKLEHKSEAYLKINPRGQVAALETPDGNLSENAAIMIYLNDKHNGKMLNEGQGDYARANAMLWLMFANSGLHGAYSKCMFIKNNCGDADVMKKACDNVQAQWDEIEAHLNRAGTKFLAGDKITAGDIYTAVVANWQFIPHLPTFGPKTQALIDAVSAMSSFQTVLEKENVEYKVA